jgi:hypothetical protein
MGTDINIKKKIAAKEEGVTITNDLSSLNFVGAGVTASIIGDEVTVTVPGSIGATTYYLNETVTQAPYKEFSSVPTSAAEQTIANTVSAGSTITVQSFQTPSGVPNTTNIPAGLWQFYLHFSGTFGDSWDIYVEVYKRDLGGIETLLLTTDLIPTTSLNAIPTMILTDGVFATATVLTTDRIVVKVKATNSGVANQTITFHTEGSTNYSVGTTTLNQVVGAGSVTSVTGTAPIASSGGTTPAISISQATTATDGYLSSTDWNTFNGKVPTSRTISTTAPLTGGGDLSANRTFAITQATTSTDGYLSSTDWNTFNGKQNALTLTTTGTSGPATLVGATLNIPQYAGGLVYFAEAQSTAAPNATVNVDSLTALASTTDADFTIKAKGAGSILAQIPDSTTTGGDKRGQYSVDLQMSRSAANQVVSGNYSFAAGAANRVTAAYATGIGNGCLASNNWATAIGRSNTASGDSSLALGFNSTASNNRSVAIGETCTASGTNAISIGASSTASGANSNTLGYLNTASQSNATAIGYNNQSVGQFAVSIGSSNIASGTNSVAIGTNAGASGVYSLALGYYSATFVIYGRQSYASGRFTQNGDAQTSLFVLRAETLGTTATTLTTNGGGAFSNNQVILSDDSAYRFKGSIIGKESGTLLVGAWDIDGVLVRGTGVATVTLVIGNVNVITNPPTWGTPTLAADTTNGGLRIQVTGATGVNIRWTCRVDTTEIIFPFV